MNIDGLLYYPPESSYTADIPGYGTAPVPHILCQSQPQQRRRLQRTIIYYHGNAVDCGQMREFGQYLANEAGCNVMLIEYPGYGPYQMGQGNSSIRTGPSSQQIRDDVKVLARHLLHSNNMYYVMGQSIGTGPAAYLSRKIKKQCLGLLLLTPYISFRTLARDYSILGMLVYNYFTPLNDCKETKIPVRVYHGTQDEIIDYSHAVQYNMLPHVALHSYHCTHNDIIDHCIADLLRILVK